jgi:hypothetical protein
MKFIKAILTFFTLSILGVFVFFLAAILSFLATSFLWWLIGLVSINYFHYTLFPEINFWIQVLGVWLIIYILGSIK